MVLPRRFSKEQSLLIKEEYDAGDSLSVLASRWGGGPVTIWNTIRYAGGACRSQKEATRKHALDETVFDDIQTEEVAYALGFIWADGNVSQSTLSITLQRRDKAHLQSLANALRTSAPVREYMSSVVNGRKHQLASLSVSSVALMQSLLALGCMPNKCFIIKPWEGPAHLMRHFYRGLFDGDGSFPKMTHHKTIGVCLAGNKQIIDGFEDFVFEQTGFRGRAYLRMVGSGRTWMLSYKALDAKQAVARLLYDEASIYLPRKMDLARRLLKIERRPVRDLSWVTRDLLLSLYQQEGSWNAVGRRLQLSRCFNIHSLRRQHGLV